jgi:4-hydroxy-4-methyl-2-oxoglutarate aldolase
MIKPLTPEQIEALRLLDACALANAIESFGVRLRNEGFADGSVHCIFPRMHPVVGHAVTIKIRGANPPTGASTYLENTDWWDYILSVPPPRIVMVQDVSSKPGLGAFLGEVHANILRALGCVGAATNGAVRDLPAVEDLGFQFFAGTRSVSHSYVHIVETGTPISIGGLTISSGDIVHGDQNGLQTVPPALIDQIPAAAAAIAARERRIIVQCRAANVTLEKLRSAVGKAHS